MKKSLLGLSMALLALTLTTPAMALLLPLTYSNTFGSGTYGAIELTDIVGGVQVAANYNPAVFTPTAGSFGVTDVYLNLIPLSYTGGITFTQIGTQNNGGTTTWILQAPAKADGFGDFTLNATNGPNSALTRIPIDPSPGFTTLFTLKATGLEVSDFLAFSKNNQGKDTEWMAAMHLAGYTRDGSAVTSEFLASPVPIPGAAWLLGSGVLALIGLKRRNRNNDR